MLPPDSARLKSPEILAAFAAFAVAAVLAVASRGLAGDEEVAHYLIARYAPEQPGLFLSLTGRPLVTLALTLPAQANLILARLVAAVATGFSAYAVARIAIRTGWIGPGWATALLLAQPFFLAHAGKAMTEPIAAGLLAWGLLAIVEGRFRTLTVVAALLPLARTETVVFWPLVAWVLIHNRVPHLLWFLPLPIFLWNGLGALKSGDPLWLIHQSKWRVYPQRSWMDYPRSLIWILGLGLFVPFLVGLTRSFLVRGSTTPVVDGTKERFRALALRSSAIMVLSFFVLYTILAVWHPITFGNLRYFAYAGPAFALLAAAGIHALTGRRSPWLLAPLAAGVAGSFLVWNHPLINDFGIMVRTDWTPAIVAGVWVAVLALPRRMRVVLPLIAVLGGAGDIAWRHTDTLHLERNPKESALLAAATLPTPPHRETASFHLAHPAIAFFQHRNFYDRDIFLPVTPETRASATPGAVLFWETHYSILQSPRLAAPGFFSDPTWRYLGGVIAADSSWAGGYFVRTDSTGITPGEFQVSGGMDETAWKNVSTLIQLDIPRIQRNIRKDPENAAYWRDLSDRLGIAGLVPQARTALARAQGIEPDNPLNFAFEANLLRLSGNLDEAYVAAQRALSIRPQDGVLHYLNGRILLDLNREDEAAAHLKQAADQLTKRWDIQFDCGRALLRMGRVSEAEPYALTAMDLQPQNVSYLIMISEIQWRLGRTEKAMERLRDFTRRQPQHSTPYLMLGDFLAHQGDTLAARAVWEEGQEKTGGDPRIASRLAKP